MSYQLISAAPRGERRQLCALLGVPPSSFYAWAAQQWAAPGPRAERDRALVPALRAAHQASRGTYGRPRLTRELCAQGYPVGERRVGRLLRELGLLGGRRGAWRRRGRSPQAAHRRTVAGNVLARDFHVGELDRAWVCDTTQLPTRDGGVVLAAVLDLGTRRVIGWAIGRQVNAALTTRALEHALRSGRRPRLHHSDQGSEYVAGVYGARLAAEGIPLSWSRPRNCWDNAVMESFFATVKLEAVPAAGVFDSLAHADLALFEYLEIFYNRERRHSALGYRAPVTYERTLSA
jgi:transposase InsO family protein